MLQPNRSYLQPGKFLLYFISITLAGCSGIGIDKEHEARIKQLTGCENVTAGFSSSVSTEEGAKSIRTLTIINPTKVSDDQNEVKAMSEQIVMELFDDLSKVDTTIDNVHIIFKFQGSTKGVDFSIADVMNSLGMRAMQSAPQNAIPYFDLAVRLSPELKFYHNRANAYYESKMYDKALPDFIKASELNPTDPEELRGAGMAYLGLNDLPNTKKIADQCISMDPSKASPYALRARYYRKMSKLDSSAIDFSKAISTDSTISKWKRELAEVYFEKSEFKKALTAADRFLSQENNSGEGYYLRGKIRSKLREETKACEDINKAMSLGIKDEDGLSTKCK